MFGGERLLKEHRIEIDLSAQVVHAHPVRRLLAAACVSEARLRRSVEYAEFVDVVRCKRPRKNADESRNM